MRLLQGAGPRGLGGIAPVRGRLIRPLIETRRVAIEAYLGGRGLAWAEDPSNRDVRFLRNRIRHDLLPFIARVSDASVVEALGRSAAAARAVVADLEERARAELDAPGHPRRRRAGPRRRRARRASDRAGRGDPPPGRRAPRRDAAAAGPAQRALRRLLGEAPPRRAARLGRLAVERSGRRLRVGPGRCPRS